MQIIKRIWNAQLGPYYTVGDSIMVSIATLTVLAASIAVVAQ